jgi:hypothetical protein
MSSTMNPMTSAPRPRFLALCPRKKRRYEPTLPVKPQVRLLETPQ